jgi:hypothetical protein
MSEIEFIKKTLKEWCERFVGIHVRYAYDAVSEYHIIEVDPESIRRGNDEYKEAELSLWTAFMELYPNADLLITKPSEANDMSNCLFNSDTVCDEDFFISWDFSQILTTFINKDNYNNSYNIKGNNEYALAA